MTETSGIIARAAKPRYYLVLKRRGKWCAKSLGRFGLQYASQDKAVVATIECALKIWESGRDATVSVFVEKIDKVVWRRIH